ncbi:MAG: WYL domain-containing transcriptional regulator, partial [Syntrophobacteraceae bacterium]
MAGLPQLERLIWFHERLKRRRFPNTSQLAERFEISRKTAQRHITFLRDRLCAPMDYDSSRKGYFYYEDGFELPRMPLPSQDEMLAVLIARRLLSYPGEGLISEAFQAFSRRLHKAASAMGIDGARLEKAFSASWHGFSPASDNIFRGTVEALVQSRPILIEYHSPGSRAVTRRTVEPHHLQHYMASWVLVAFCRLRRDWRKFYLARINSLESQPETFQPRPREQWLHLLRDAFGIFQGPATIPVTLRFNAFRARWVRGQQWHSAQELRELEDGGIELSFPIADFREVKMMILQF